MAGKAAGGGGDIKGSDIFKALIDLIILALLMVGSGFGGYWYGVHERLAPVKNVAPGTPGALPASAVTPVAPGTQPAPTAATPATSSTATTTTTATPTAPSTATTTSAPAASSEKFWITSSGTDYIGYNITVSVNGSPVDSFYGPDKTINLTRFVKHGENTITFDAKNMPNINKHKGQPTAMLTLKLVHGPKITDEFKPGDVLLSYTRNAGQTEDDTKELTFTDGD